MPTRCDTQSPLRTLLTLALLATTQCTDPVDESPPEPAASAAEHAPSAGSEAEDEDGNAATGARRGDAREPATVPADVASGALDEEGATEDALAEAPEPSPQDPDADPDADTDADDQSAAPTVAAPDPSMLPGTPTIHSGIIEGFEIQRFALAQDIVDREPVMITARFTHDSGPLHVFIEAQNRTGEDVRLRVGFHPASTDRRGAGVLLTIPNSPRYRTRARANTRRAPGAWVCEVTDERDRVLVRQEFEIVPATGAD